MIATYSQDNNPTKRVKYITKAPDGSVSLAIYDDSQSDILHMEAVNSFYKFELVDLNSGDIVYGAYNRGTKGKINKSILEEGLYKLRIYTEEFIISSKIAIRHAGSLLAENKDLLALQH